MAKQQRVVPEQSQQAPAFDVCDAAMDQQPANGSNAFSVETAGLETDAADAALERDMVHDLYDQMWAAKAFHRVGAWTRDAAHLDSWLRTRSLAQVFADPGAVALQDWILDRLLPPGVTQELQLERQVDFALQGSGTVGVGNVARASVRRVGRALILDWEGESTVSATLGGQVGDGIDHGAQASASAGMTLALGVSASVGLDIGVLPQLVKGAVTPTALQAVVPATTLWPLLQQGKLGGVQVTYGACNEVQGELQAGDRDEWVPFREALGSAGVFDQFDVLAAASVRTEFQLQAGLDAAQGAYATFRATFDASAQGAMELDPALLELGRRAGLDLGRVASAFELAAAFCCRDAGVSLSLAFTVFPDAPQGARLQMVVCRESGDRTLTRTVVGADAVTSELLAVAIPGDTVQHGVVEQEVRAPAPELLVRQVLAERGLRDPGAHTLDDDKSEITSHRDFELVSTLRCWARDPAHAGAVGMSEMVDQGLAALRGQPSTCDAELEPVRLVGSVVRSATLGGGIDELSLDVQSTGTHTLHLDQTVDVDPLTFLDQLRAR